MMQVNKRVMLAWQACTAQACWAIKRLEAVLANINFVLIFLLNVVCQNLSIQSQIQVEVDDFQTVLSVS
jgi:hypothetical protein